MGSLCHYFAIDHNVLKFLICPHTMFEKKFAGNAQFEAYKKPTSAFFPLPRKDA